MATLLAVAVPAMGQSAPVVPAVRVGVLPPDLKLDGRLDEPAWATADEIANLTMTEPTAGAAPTSRTGVRVLASARALVIGVICDDPDPGGIVSFTKQRDGSMSLEDHIEIVLDTHMDGRSGYAFWVNPGGARYDGLIGQGGEIDGNWDGIWEAATKRSASGWSAEIRIPIQTLSFTPGLRAWHFNIQRRVQRLQETDRWASPVRDYKLTQMSRAGLIEGLPAFDLGLGLTVRPSVVGGGGVRSSGASLTGEAHGSLDVTKRLGANMLASATVNTDFAETEVDARQTNLTRFSLYFPEKRAFFLEGSDAFQFGSGLGSDVVPFFSRTIGLVEERQVPIRVAGRISGRVGSTSIGGVVARTGTVSGLVAAATVGAIRIKQDILGESSVGAIATFGDPAGRRGSWLAGGDFTYRTSHFAGDKNFLVGAWGLATGQDGAHGDRSASGIRVAYPNDLWNVSLTYMRIGDGFQPSLGFVPRPGTQTFSLVGEFDPRPKFLRIRQMFNEFEFVRVADLHGRWQSYRVFLAPVNWRFESGDRVEVNIRPTGENLPAPFEIADGVVIPAGPYHWMRYRLEFQGAAKRKLSGQATWWFGGFYDGRLDQMLLTLAWNPTALFTLSLSAERDIGRLRAGRFDQTLVGTRLRVNASPNLEISSFIQYDTESGSFGTNSRLRWTFHPQGDLFVIYNHNLKDITDRWQFQSNQLLVKLAYSWRY